MFSGLTNQVTSWMGSAKGDQEEKVPTPTEEGNVVSSPDKKDASPTKPGGGSRLDMLTNVRSQIEGIGGWLGSSIPKLRKGEEGGLEDQQVPVDEGTAQGSAEPAKGSPQHKEDDDNSSFLRSATGGADSGPQSIAETPTEEKEGQFGNVQSKALAGAKSFGNFLYSAVNKAGKTVSEASAKIKETVEKNSILGEFNKEQEAFLKGQAGNTATALPPWAGCSNEEALKEECLSLSTDKKNFVRSPPAGIDFQFDYQVSYPVAMAIMEQDPNLEKMRYELVPKVISEENFWRNYFYRVSLICQANELSFMSRDGDSQSAIKPVTSDQPIEEWERELVAELHDYEVVAEEKPDGKRDVWEQEIEEIEEMLKDGTDLK
ncbi:synapse-associated protein of 47 kDa isoform X3 [Zophobas morio]|uniref:synapse-associated protein of 47 kDa isoform X3 n=1 Tax=Zophobas morio TaxID=2755281 RepID=UPI0030837CE0